MPNASPYLPFPTKICGESPFLHPSLSQRNKTNKAMAPPFYLPGGDSQELSLPSIRDTWSCRVFPTPYCGYFPSWLLHLSSSQLWDWGARGGWGEALGGSTHHHLPPRRGTKRGGTAAGLKAWLKDAPRRVGAVRSIPDLAEKRPPCFPPCLAPFPRNRFICHLTPIPIIVRNCDMIYCPSSRHFSFS